MSRHRRTLDAQYFERLYAANPDPWDFSGSRYEQEKYAATLAALPNPRYRRALEVGCSIGVLTRQLAERCSSVIAIDPVASAVEAARERCADQPQVTFKVGEVPQQWPEGEFDLLIFSEVLYYFDRDDLALLADRTLSSLDRSGNVLLVHWLGETDYPLSGDEAAEAFIELVTKNGSVRQDLRGSDRSAQYRLDLLRAA